MPRTNILNAQSHVHLCSVAQGFNDNFDKVVCSFSTASSWNRVYLAHSCVNFWSLMIWHFDYSSCKAVEPCQVWKNSSSFKRLSACIDFHGLNCVCFKCCKCRVLSPSPKESWSVYSAYPPRSTGWLSVGVFYSNFIRKLKRLLLYFLKKWALFTFIFWRQARYKSGQHLTESPGISLTFKTYCFEFCLTEKRDGRAILFGRDVET